MQENLAEQFSLQMSCFKSAGLYDKTFLAFGSLLGFVREGGFIPHDDDMDIGVLVDDVSKERIDDYVERCRAAGLFKYRERHEINPVTGKHFWTSLRMHPEGKGFKCCTWFMWTFKGYIWHCKGIGALIKGCPERFLQPGPEVEFLGTSVKIPKMPGSALDLWYPDWVTSRTGGNSNATYMAVKNWADTSTWIIKG